MRRVIAGDGIEQHCGVLNRARERANLVEGRCERDKTVTGYCAIGGLEADHAAERSGLTDRATGIRTECERHFAGCDNGCRTTRRAAGHTVSVVRVAGELHS